MNPVAGLVQRGRHRGRNGAVVRAEPSVGLGPRRSTVPGHPGRSLLRHVLAGLALSTLAVSVVGRWATAAGLGPGMTTLLVQFANAVAFGARWVSQFAILDRWLFRAGAASAPHPSPELEESRCP